MTITCDNAAPIWTDSSEAKTLAWKIKSPITNKDEKKDVRSNLATEILKAAKENYTEKVAGESREIFRFKVKLKDQLVSFQWEGFFEDICYGYLMSPAVSEPTGGILRTDTNECFLVSREGAELIKSLLYEGEQGRTPLIPFLNGNRFEWIKTTKQKALPLNYFDSWENQKVIYREKIYPLCLECLKQVMPDQASVLELCGGDGEFASLLFNQMEEKIDSYVLIDANKKSIEKAKEALKDKIAQSKVQVIEGKVSNPNYKEIYNDKQVDLILGIGALTEQVIASREIALMAITNAVSKLKEGGYVVLTGLTTSWLMSSDFEDLGLEVLNYYNTAHLPQELIVDNVKLSSEFYVARKVKKDQNKPAPSWSFDPPKMRFLVQHARFVEKKPTRLKKSSSSNKKSD